MKKKSFIRDRKYYILFNYFSIICVSHWDENVHVLECNARKIFKAENSGKGYIIDMHQLHSRKINRIISDC